MSNKESYERLQKMILDGEDVEKINAEFDVARDAMNSVDSDGINANDELIPYPFMVAWGTAFGDFMTSCDCSPEIQLRGLKWCLDVIEYLEWKHYI